MKQPLVIGLLIGLLAIEVGSPPLSHSVTFRRVGFDEMVQQSAVIVQGRVLTLESTWNRDISTAARAEQRKDSQSPAEQPDSALQAQGDPAPASPVGVATEGGRMIFTRVTMETIEPIKGATGQVVEFFIAGGALDGRVAIVSGLPKFEVGETYVVFLQSGFADKADPIVGVNQGVFRVVQHPESGLPVLLNADSDYVSGIEDNRVVSQRNPQAAGDPHRPVHEPIGPPTPDNPDTQSVISPEVQRYWSPSEPPMTVDAFIDAVRTRLGR